MTTNERSVGAEERAKTYMRISEAIEQSEQSAYERGRNDQIELGKESLEEMMADAYDRGFKDGDHCTAQTILTAYREGLEAAAKVAETPIRSDGKNCYECDCCGEVPQTYIAERIRGLKGKA